MSILIKGGTIVTATDQYVGDVFVEGDKITTIGSALSMPADKVIDAKGKYVLPGGIDVHTHMDMPFGGTTSADDFESGTIAAAFGGTTTIVDFAIQYRGETLHHAFETWSKKAAGTSRLTARLSTGALASTSNRAIPLRILRCGASIRPSKSRKPISTA